MIAPRHNSTLIAVVILVVLTATAPPQASKAQAGKAPSVTFAPVGLVTARRAAQTMVNLDFRVSSGFHINSNAPKDEYLIPTSLKMDLPTDIILGKIEYPDGQGYGVSFFSG